MQRMIWLSLLTSLTLTACAQAQVPQPASGDIIQITCAETAVMDGSNDPNAAPNGAETTAAIIKKDEGEMQARREAVRYLGTVDWGRWPEAEKALVEALLYDRSECVRFEAALALQKGCCCTKLAVKALTDCVTGVSKPAENSERVKLAAKQALSHNIRKADPMAFKDKDIEKDKKPALTQAEYYQHVPATPQADVMAQARKALAEGQAGNSASTPSSVPRPGNVAQIVT
ncbi:MAG TPA: hypothetical protein VE988_04390, partial [Gemmataceae bacterium]|nr:hypothetical protein [Gemmataceae bacterium]